jgi:uncharacterized protein (DUF1778 family)
MSKLPEAKIAKRTAPRESARRAAEEAPVIHLSPTDQRAFVRAILNPPPPGANLRRAALAYRRHVNSSA